MSVSTAPGGPRSQYTLDPRDIELNASRLSQYSHNSSTSGIVLGGIEYPVGSRVGKSGQFVIGDPQLFEPHKSFESIRSSAGSTINSQKGLIETQPIEDKGYGFEDWNWQIIRLSCFIAFIGVMITLFALTIGLSVEHKLACDSPYKWWQGSVIYSIPVPYFRDLDDDGVGDFQGLREKLDYVEYLDTKVISLTHLLASEEPYWELYTSFQNVDPRLGDMSQLSKVISRAKDELKVKILLEMTPYYTSKQHSWFQDSRRNSASHRSYYDEFYVWRNQREITTRGNYTYDLWRDMHYFNYFESDRPVLFWGNHKVRDEFRDIMKFWLKQGIDGFIMRGMDKMFVYRNSDLLSAVELWRELLDDNSEKYEEKVLMVEETLLRKISKEDPGLVDDFVRNIDLVEVELKMGRNATYSLKRQIDNGYKYTKKVKGPWTCWKLSGMTSVDPLYRTSLQMLQLMLPGTSIMLAGQETGDNFFEMTFNRESPPRPLIWKLQDIFPRHPGLPQNTTTIKALKKLIVERQSETTLRLDSIFEPDDNVEKNFNFRFVHLNYRWMLLERTYKRKNAYYYAGNYYNKDQSVDMLHISPEGHIVSDSFNKFKGAKNLEEVKLMKAQGIVYLVRH